MTIVIPLWIYLLALFAPGHVSFSFAAKLEFPPNGVISGGGAVIDGRENHFNEQTIIKFDVWWYPPFHFKQIHLANLIDKQDIINETR